jgi:hypothetical protein
MRAVLKTNNIVLLSFAGSLLTDARIESVVFDEHSSVMDGSLGFLQRRLMVAEEDYDQAVRILRDGLKDDYPNP